MAAVCTRMVGAMLLSRSVASLVKAPSALVARYSSLGKLLHTPRIGQVAAPLQSLAGSSIAADIGAVRHDSTKRKRAKKMNKHKYQKMMKKMRNLTAKNIKGG